MPPCALMSATTAFIVSSALPISGARFCSVSSARSAEIIEILIVSSVSPTVFPDPVSVPEAVVELGAASSSSDD